MKNLSEYREEPSAPRVPRSGGHDPFRFRKRVTDHGQKLRAQKDWRREDPGEYRLASLRKLILGRLPKRAAKYGCADFDLEDMSEYEGDDGTAIAGHELAGIAAHIVRCAKHPVDYLFSLRNVPAKVLGPIKVYLRVKLAMGRLRDEIENATRSLKDDYSYEVPAYAVCKQTANRDDRNTKPANSPPTFKWHISPAKIHDFKTQTERCGYDPRETSVYWVEKRANALRRKWKKHGRMMRVESPLPKSVTRPKAAFDRGENAAPKIKYFTPKDVDYNSVWPPVKMPDGPPKMADAARESMAEIKFESKPEKDIIENGSETPEQDSCASEVSGVCFAQRGDDRVYCDNDRAVMTAFMDCGLNPAPNIFIEPEINLVHERAPP